MTIQGNWLMGIARVLHRENTVRASLALPVERVLRNGMSNPQMGRLHLRKMRENQKRGALLRESAG